MFHYYAPYLLREGASSSVPRLRDLAPSDLPPPIGPLTPAHDLCVYPSGLEGLGACALAQSRYSLRDVLTFRFRGGIRRTCQRAVALN
jgi:hypothetical protein